MVLGRLWTVFARTGCVLKLLYSTFTWYIFFGSFLSQIFQKSTSDFTSKSEKNKKTCFSNLDGSRSSVNRFCSDRVRFKVLGQAHGYKAGPTNPNSSETALKSICSQMYLIRKRQEWWKHEEKWIDHLKTSIQPWILGAARQQNPRVFHVRFLQTCFWGFST